MAIHESARGFDAAADVYERGRPPFPAEATDILVQELRLAPESVVLDVGAGTGKLTRALAGTGARVIALEPLEGMRRRFSALLPETWMVGGVAEHIPLSSAFADAAVAGNAFHWFANTAALAEIRRVLKPSGRLGLIWTWVDESVDWVEKLSRLVDQYQGDTPRHINGGWESALKNYGGFRSLSSRSFYFVRTGGFEIISDHVLSVSFVGKMAARGRNRVVDEVRNFVVALPSTRGGARIELPYRTQLFIYERRSGPASEADRSEKGRAIGQ